MLTHRLASRLHILPIGYRQALTRMIADYEVIFAGRTAELAALDRFLLQPQPYAFLPAPTGRGKTALLMHWLAQLDEQAVTCIFLPVSRRYQTATARSTLTAFAHALATVYQAEPPSAMLPPDQLRPTIAAFLRQEPPEGRQLLVVLDGIDEAIGWQPDASLFPQQLGPRIHIVASARDVAHKTRADWLADLGWKPAHTIQLALPALSQQDIGALFYQQAGDFGEGNVEVVKELARVSEGDPLTVRMLLEGMLAGTLSLRQLTSQPPGIEAQLQHWLAELSEYTTAHAHARRLLSLCAAALGPLSTTDILAVDPDVFAGPSDVQAAAEVISRFVIGNGESESGYVFSHPRLREIYYEHILSAEKRAQVQDRFVAYGQVWYANRSASLPEYLRHYWLSHLADAEQWETMRAVLLEMVPGQEGVYQPWASARYAVEGSYSGYLSDLDLLWRRAEQRDELGLGLHCALIAASLRSLSTNIPAALFPALIEVGTPEGRWSVAAVLEHIRQLANPRPGAGLHRQQEALNALLCSGIALPMDLVLEVTRSIREDRARAESLILVARHLPAEQQLAILEEAMGIVCKPDYPYTAEETLAGIVPLLPQARREAVCDEILDRAPKVYSFRPSLKLIAPFLTPALVEKALALTPQLQRQSSRIECLALLAPLLSRERQSAIYEEIFNLLQSHPLHSAGDSPLSVVLSRVGKTLPAEYLPRMLEQAQRCKDPLGLLKQLITLHPGFFSWEQGAELAHLCATSHERADLLCLLLHTLPGPHGPARYAAVLEALSTAITETHRPQHQGRHYDQRLDQAQRYDQEFKLAKVLGLLIDVLPEILLDEARLLCFRLTNPIPRAYALLHAVQRLPAVERSALALQALDAVPNDDGTYAAETLPPLMVYLSREATASLLDRLSVGSDPDFLIAVAAQRPLDERPALYGAALAEASRIGNRTLAIGLLIELVPHGMPLEHEAHTQAAEALRRQIALDYWHDTPLSWPIMLPYLPEEMLAQILDRIHEVDDEFTRKEIVEGLIRVLPTGYHRRIIDEFRNIDHLLFFDEVELLPYLSPADREYVIRTAPDGRNERDQLWISIIYLDHLPQEQHEAIYTAVLNRAPYILDLRDRCTLMMRIARLMPEQQRDGLYAEVLELSQGAADEDFNRYGRASVLKDLAEAASPALHPTIFQLALTLEDVYRRLDVLMELAERAEPGVFEQVRVVLRPLLAALQPSVLGYRFHSGSEKLLPDVMQIIEAIPDLQDRLRPLAMLLPRLGSTEQARVRDFILGHIDAVNDTREKAWVLSNMIAHLPVERLDYLLANIDDLSDCEYEPWVFHQLAEHMPADRMPDLLAYVHSRAYVRDRSAALIDLATPMARAYLNDPSIAAAMRQEWHRVVRRLAEDGRGELLCGLSATWLAAALPPSEIAYISQTLRQILKAWP